MGNHLSQEKLLRYFDGELSETGASKATEHLRTCESCALELRHLKQHLAMMGEGLQILEDSLPSPPKPWPSLESRLDAVTKTSNSGNWRGLFKSLEVVWRFSLAYGGTALVLLLIGLLIWGPMQRVSAKEVLQRATAADNARLTITPQQVVRQRVRITENSRRVSRRTMRLESWKSTKSAYWETGNDPLNADLHHRYQDNGLGSDLPLSPPALESWVKLAGSQPTASRQGGRIEVQVAANAEGRTRGLEAFSFRVQTSDWHVDEMKLSFADASFQIDEEDSSILDRRDVPADVLERLEPTEPKPAGADVPHASRGAGSAPPAVNAVNMDDLEMSVRYNLHQAGADLGDNIEVAPGASGQVLVKAWGVSLQRKEQLTDLLGNRPGIKLEFQPPVAGRQGPPRVITAIPQSNSQQQDDRLVTFFGGADAQENFTRGVLRASTDVLAHLYALQQLAVRWPPGQDSNLSAAGKTQLAGIVRDHARAVQMAASELKSQVDFLLKGFGQEVPSDVSPGTGAPNWQAVSASTFESARTLDHILRSLLTTSDTPMLLNDALPKLRQSVPELTRGANQLASVAR